MVRKVGRPGRRKAAAKAPKPSRPRALDVLPIEELSRDRFRWHLEREAAEGEEAEEEGRAR